MEALFDPALSKKGLPEAGPGEPFDPRRENSALGELGCVHIRASTMRAK